MTDGAQTFDLQSHSTFSDGELSPAEVVARAASSGIRLMALSDHDTVDGVAAAQAAGSGHGIKVVSAVEMSVLDPVAQDLHLLGYLIDPLDEPLLDALQRSRGDRENRAERIIATLEALGLAVDRSLLVARVEAGQTIGRPHLAEAVFTHPANNARMAQEGLSDSTAFLVAYLIDGTPAFIPREAPSIEHAIELIHGAGGVAVWAHPFWDVDREREVLEALDRFVSVGLDGVEAFYASHSRAQTELLVDRCEELQLLSTGSADFHGPSHPHFNRFGAFLTFGRRPNLGPIDA
jgi:predicted metal-dependent phosphoesterase TrpH